jgi:HEAT repeat protein
MKLVTVLCLFGLLGFLIFGCLPRGAMLGGSRQDPEKILADLESKDSEVRIGALIQIRNQPEVLENPKIIELILGKMAIKDETERGAASMIVDSHKDIIVTRLRPFLESKNFEEYIRATAAIRIIGEPAAVYSDVVGKNLRESLYGIEEGLGPAEVRGQQAVFKIRLASMWAIEAMGKETCQDFGDDVLKVVQAKFEPGQEFNLQVAALRIFAEIGPDAKRYLPHLVDLLNQQETNLSVRSQLMITLGAIGSSEEVDVVPILIERLSANQYKEKLSAIEGLAKMGPSASTALPMLENLMEDRNKGVNGQAAYAYFRISGDAAKAVTHIERELKNPSKEHEMLEIARQMGPDGAPLLDVLIKKLTSEEPFTREYSVLALKGIRVNKPSVIAALTKVAKNDPDQFIREQAVAALQEIQSSK